MNNGNSLLRLHQASTRHDAVPAVHYGCFGTNAESASYRRVHDLPPDENVPGTFASWTGSPFAAPMDVAGEPTLDVQVHAPLAIPNAGPGGELVLFAKLYDVAPDGTASLVHNLIAPMRIADPTKPLHVTLPATVHRFAAGHEIRLVLGSGDSNYRSGLASMPVTAPTGDQNQVLSLPVTAE